MELSIVRILSDQFKALKVATKLFNMLNPY